MKYLKENNKSNKLKDGNNGMWKGKKAGIMAIHRWVSLRKIKPEFCEICKKVPPVDLANISQKYKRDINDFEYLCRKCHMTKDGRLKKFSKLSRKKALPILVKKCLCCKKQFKTKRTTHTTCSLSCSVRYRMAVENKREISPLIYKCPTCLNVMKKTYFKTKYCSRACSSNRNKKPC